MGKYVAQCLVCGREYENDPLRLQCDDDHEPSLLRAVYRKKKLTLFEDMPGMFKFYDFLPVERTLDVKGAPVTYKSEGLARFLGLENLYIIFNGYWPEREAYMFTASFKELEAPPVLSRVPEDYNGTIVVASAGNTGRAFANICSKNRIPLILVVPEQSIEEIWSNEPLHECVKLLVAGGNSDYYDAITLADKVTPLDGFFPEGGAKNIARRDGMATTLLDAAITMGRIPDHYFQAVGSGTGGVAAWEASLRLREDGSFGGTVMKLHLSQNYPFVPMVEAWDKGEGVLPPLDEKKAKDAIRQAESKVLSNRKPPYSVRGGVYDAMKACSGYMYSVTNQEAQHALRNFEEYEHIDICSAAGVAVGSLIQAIEKGTIKKDDFIALNITGGGEKRVKAENDIFYLKPFLKFTDEEIHSSKITARLQEMLAFA